MDTEEQNKPETTEEVPAFSFKEVKVAESENIIPESDVVEIPDEEEKPEISEEEVKAPEEKPETEEIKTEEKPEDKKEPETIPEEKKDDDEVVDLNEDLAFNFLKDKYGLKFDKVEDFLKSGETKKVDPEIEKYQEYKAKTGRSYSDFLETQREWSKESPETIIKAVLKLENPDLSSEEINFLFEKDYGYDEDVDSDYDIKLKKIDLKVDSKKSLAVLEKQKADYLVERGSEDIEIPEVYKEAKELVDRLYDEQAENEEKGKVLRNDFVTKVQSALPDNFGGFKFTVDGQDFLVKPDDIAKFRNEVTDINNFQNKFFDKEQSFKDPNGYTKGFFGGMHVDEVFKIAFNLGKTTYAEELEKKSKNIDVKGEKHVPEPQIAQFTFKKA